MFYSEYLYVEVSPFQSVRSSRCYSENSSYITRTWESFKGSCSFGPICSIGHRHSISQTKGIPPNSKISGHSSIVGREAVPVEGRLDSEVVGEAVCVLVDTPLVPEIVEEPVDVAVVVTDETVEFCHLSTTY